MSSSNQQAAIAAEARIQARQVEYREQLSAFALTMSGEAPLEEKRRQFLLLVGHATAFGNLCEQSVGDASLLGATKDDEWARTKAETSLNVLDHILQSQTTLLAVVDTLALPEETVRPSPTAYASLQRNAALFFPERIETLRRSFIDAGLPVTGFDEAVPVSPPRRDLRSQRSRWKTLHREVQSLVAAQPNSSIPAGRVGEQVPRLEAEGARLIATYANWLAERWAACGFHRRPKRQSSPRRAVLADEVPLPAFEFELAERVVILDLVDDELLRIEHHSASADAHYFHVLVKVESGAHGMALDLTRERLTADIAEPLLSGKVVRIDGHAVRRDAPLIKITRTDRNSAAFAREHERQMQKRGISDLSTDRRRLPIDRGQDVTTSFLGAMVPDVHKKAAASGDSAMRTHATMLWIVFVLGIATIIAGALALVLSSTGTTSLEIVGASLKTSNVGVACILGGCLIAWLGMRSVLRSVKDLETLKVEAAQSKTRGRKSRGKKSDGGRDSDG